MVVSGQESKSFWSSNSLRPDVVLRQGYKTYIIDTKWKRPQKSSASVGDLKQMYAYCRFWDAERALLLYPGQAYENKFRSYLTDDYSKDTEDVPNLIDHQCKMGFVSVINEKNELDSTIGENSLKLLE